jgi:hypothetical protein
MDARLWLRANDYDDVADMIDEVMDEWHAQGKKTRRNWWDVLSGGKNGIPCRREGREWPVLRAAQLRQGKPVTKNAICRNPKEEIPPIQLSGRWPKQDVDS